jgi:hypothetical protein
MLDREFEALRLRYRPTQIRVLFVAESRPTGGTFFYAANSHLVRYTEAAFRHAYGFAPLPLSEFLDAFKATGCYLEDLCPEPVNQIKTHALRRAAWKGGMAHLAKRLAGISPLAIIAIHKGSGPYVRQTVEKAGLLNVLKPAIPFPSMGNHPRYIAGLSLLIQELREASILPARFLPEGLQFSS